MATRRHNQRQTQKGKRLSSHRVNGRSSPPDQERVPGNVAATLFLQRTIGNQATARLIQRQQEEEEGSATVVGSAGETEGAIDEGSFTKDVTNTRAEDSTPTEDELGETLKKKSRQAHEVKRQKGFHTQHPSMAQLGIRPKEIKGKKLATYIGNDTYPAAEWIELPGAKADTRRMKSTMKEHGYETVEHARNKTAPEIEATFDSAMGNVNSGDALFLYYAGHGIPGGVAGVNSELQEPGAKDEAGKGGGRGLKKYWALFL